MAYDSDNLDIHLGTNESKWLDPTYYGEGNNIPLGHIALKGEYEPKLTPDEQLIIEAIRDCELRN